MNLLGVHPKATPQHRLGGFALDIALIFSTCFVGWMIWSLVIWGQGLTPGKQILKMKVVSSQTGLPATWGHMAIRQFLIPLAFGLPFFLLSFMFQPYMFDYELWADPYAYENLFYNSMGSMFVSILSWAVSLIDALWIFNAGKNRRVTDLIAKTDVVNTSAQLPNSYNALNP
jgi:uncharacterized RDD family membrane protein YckC